MATIAEVQRARSSFGLDDYARVAELKATVTIAYGFLRAAYEKMVAVEQLVEAERLNEHETIGEDSALDQKRGDALTEFVNTMRGVDSTTLMFAAEAARDLGDELDRRQHKIGDSLDGGDQ